MRSVPILAAALALAACAVGPAAQVATSTLVAADAATSLTLERLTLSRSVQTAREDGMDPLVTLALGHADGRTLSFIEANHAETHLRAQAADGPLAQVMGLNAGETPTLYTANAQANRGAPFLCGPEGPHAIGMFESADGLVRIVGLKQEFEFETLQDGTISALPYSPDQVCARLSLRRN